MVFEMIIFWIKFKEREHLEKGVKKKRSKDHFVHPSKSKKKTSVVSHTHSTLYGALKLSVGVR